MRQAIVLLIANVEVVFAWLGTTSFIVAYHFKTKDWTASLVGRTFMHRAASMWLLLTYALTSRLLDPLPAVQQTMALIIYFIIGLMEWRLFFVLRYIQEGRVTLDNPNYSPIRDRWEKLKKRLKERSSK